MGMSECAMLQAVVVRLSDQARPSNFAIKPVDIEGYGV
jgi:hypothetical protein